MGSRAGRSESSDEHAAPGEMAKACVAFVMIDGLGDVSYKSLQMRTPLEEARTPWMDAVAGVGLTGLLDPVEPGYACGSDTAHLSILGYPPQVYYKGRGAFESMGTGLEMSAGDIAFKCNFAHMDDASGLVLRRRVDRDFEAAGRRLCKDLDGIALPSFPNHTVGVRYATEHRCGVVVRGPGLSCNITGTDPLKDRKLLRRVCPVDESDEARFTAALVQELSDELRQALRQHPENIERQQRGELVANVILLRGCGIAISVTPFAEKQGMKACMVAPTKIIAGLGKQIGIAVLEAPGATGDYFTNLGSKADVILRALAPCDKGGQGYDFGFLHVKAVDDAGHDKNLALKIEWLQKIDAMVGRLVCELVRLERDSLLIVTGDHSTPVAYGDHSPEPVPFVVAHSKELEELASGGGSESGDRRLFSERAVAQGILGRFAGAHVLPLIHALRDATARPRHAEQ